MQDALLGFARHGKAPWPRYADRRSVMHFDAPLCEVHHGEFASRFDWWQQNVFGAAT